MTHFMIIPKQRRSETFYGYYENFTNGAHNPCENDLNLLLHIFSLYLASTKWYAEHDEIRTLLRTEPRR